MGEVSEKANTLSKSSVWYAPASRGWRRILVGWLDKEDFMSSKRFGSKPKKPKDKSAKKAKKAEDLASDKKSIPATKAASTQQKHFQRRTSG